MWHHQAIGVGGAESSTTRYIGNTERMLVAGSNHTNSTAFKSKESRQTVTLRMKGRRTLVNSNVLQHKYYNLYVTKTFHAFHAHCTVYSSTQQKAISVTDAETKMYLLFFTYLYILQVIQLFSFTTKKRVRGKNLFGISFSI